MPHDYYVVLGISTSASAEDIHAAFRRRSKELHPDVSGRDSGPFLELQEAYAVLSDPARRRSYDRDFVSGARVRVTRDLPRASGVALHRRRGADIVLGGRSAEPIAPRPISLVEDFETFRPSFEEMFERLWSNFNQASRPKGERPESLHVEFLLTPEEARRGGRVRIAVPARFACPVCQGTGASGGFECWQCRGAGNVVATHPVEVSYRAGVRDGWIVRMPLSALGIDNFYFTVIFRVSGKDEGQP